MNIELLCTLGPRSMNARVIRRLTESGVSLFRINLSHTPVEDVADTIRFIQSHTDVPVCLDTEGAQVRTGRLEGGSGFVDENEIIVVDDDFSIGNPRRFYLHPGYIVKTLSPGDFLSIDFNSVLCQVISVEGSRARLRVMNSGPIGQNKAVSIEPAVKLAPLTEKDIAALAIGRQLGIVNAALSFANRPEDVDEIRRHTGPECRIISKIECQAGLDNLDGILERTDAILIDRGDLSREIAIERIPAAQKMILRRANQARVPAYVATAFLESMINNPRPTGAEVNDIYNTLEDGASGLVLAAETAIGKYPIRCANTIRKLVAQWKVGPMDRPGFYAEDAPSLLVTPHGGRLVHRQATPVEAKGAAELPTLPVGLEEVLDLEQIAFGTYSPLTGFMGKEAVLSVLRNNRLPDGTVWTMPIVYALPKDKATVGSGDVVALVDEGGVRRAILEVSEVFQLDRNEMSRLWFGTDSIDHPGVRRLQGMGDTFIAGEIKLLQRRSSPHREYELSPHQTRLIFNHKGWSRVVGFHGRNVVHRAHEFIQLEAVARCHADGLLISPVIGPRKAGDFLAGPILAAYQAALSAGDIYPRHRVVLGAFSTFARYAGPREAVFTALCRKNMGCSHFIIGRDHTGVGDFYAPTASIDLMNSFDDLGIEPVTFDAVGYDAATGKYSNDPGAQAISGSMIRERLVSGEPIDEWMMRPVVVDVLRAELAAGRPLFQE